MQINPDYSAIFPAESSQEAFQSYQFMQINPDQEKYSKMGGIYKEFQSYQFMQINPDFLMMFHN